MVVSPNNYGLTNFTAFEIVVDWHDVVPVNFLAIVNAPGTPDIECQWLTLFEFQIDVVTNYNKSWSLITKSRTRLFYSMLRLDRHPFEVTY